MFENAEFKTWAAENIVFCVGYEGKNHKGAEAAKSDDKDGDGEGGDKDGKDGKAGKGDKAKLKPGDCTLYPGITCDEHEQITKDAKAGTGGPTIEFKGWPSSFMIAPDGTVEKHTKDRSVKELIDGVADFAKKSKVKPSKKYQGYLTAFEEGDKAVEGGKWKAALTAYLKVDAVVKKTPSLAPGLATRLDTLNGHVAEAFAKVRDDASTDLVAKVKAVKALRAEVSTKLTSGNLPVVGEIDAWIKENPPPAPTPPAK